MIDTKALRQKVLDLAIRGKLVPQDPNDEPASVLLERIRAQKQQMVKDGKLKAKDIKNDTVIFVGEDNLHYEKFADGSVKCIEDEIPFDLPDGWAWCRLRDIITVCSSKRVMQSEWTKTGVPFYRAREIVKLSENGFVNNDLFISEEHYQRLKNSYDVPRAGDLMVTGVGTIGKAYIVKDTDKFYYKDASVLCFENRTGAIISDFAKMMIESDLLQEQIHSKTYGNTVDTITITTAENYICVLPPLEEQQRIISALIRAIEIIDGIENDRCNLLDTVKSLKSKILDLAIRGQLVPQDPADEPASVLLDRIRVEKEELIKQGKIKRDKKESVIFKGEDNSYYEKIGDKCLCIDDSIPFDIPDGWEWIRLGTIIDIERGGSPRPIKAFITTELNGVNWIKIGDVEKGGKYIYQTHEKIKPEGKSKSREVFPGDFLLTNSMSFGRPYISKINGCIHDGWLVLRNPDKAFDINYLYYLLSSKYVFTQFTIKASGSTVDNLNIDKVSDAIIPLPPLSEQSRIADEIEHTLGIVEQVEASLS